MAKSVRSSLRAGVGELSRSVGTFVGLAMLCYVAVLILVHATGISSDDLPIPVELIGFSVLIVAGIATGWLADGGYERLGADPTRGGTFGWLSILCLPLAFLPTRLALGYLTDLRILDYLFVLATILLACWLAFYGGLDRLGLAPEDFGRIGVYGIALGVVAIGGTRIFDAAWLTDDSAAAMIVLGIQFVACWLGIRTAD